jgi:hypothetical protein
VTCSQAMILHKSIYLSDFKISRGRVSFKVHGKDGQFAVYEGSVDRSARIVLDLTIAP